MRLRIIIFITVSFFLFGVIAAQGQSNVDISLNQPSPFPENM